MTLLPDVRRQIRDAAERQAGSRRQRLRNRVTTVGVTRRRPAPRLAFVAPVLSLLVVAAVAVAFVGLRSSKQPSGGGSSGTVTVVFRVQPTPRAQAVTQAAMSRTVAIMKERLRPIFDHVRITSSGSTVAIAVSSAPAGADDRIAALSTRGRLAFFDWEANVRTPNGKTVAGQLQSKDRTAVTVSQGSAGAAPGEPGAGGVTLYDAVRLAAKQPRRVSADNAFAGPRYFLFGTPGSRACAIAARAEHRLLIPRSHCLLAGPAASVQSLRAGLPAGVGPSVGEVFTIEQGTVVLQAADTRAGQHADFTDPAARFYVLSDHAALLGRDISNPRQSTDSTGAPDVTFSFTPNGARAFQAVTAAIARRGDLVSGLGQTLNQHFAVALDNRLITVPQIDFKTYPDGVPASHGADLAGGFTAASARDLAIVLRLGPLPLELTP